VDASRMNTSDTEEAGARVTMTFRMPPDLVDKLEAMRVRGYGRSGAAFLMMRALVDAQAEMGDLWWKVEQAAAEQHVGLGVILGRLALESQERRK